MSAGVYDGAVISDGWVMDSAGAMHVSVSNLPLWTCTDGVTLCHLRGQLSRMERAPWPYQKPRLCRLCVDELVFMGERIPDWMKEVL